MSIKKITPVLVVDAIEPVLPLWDALGFARTAEVPHGDRLGFVILAADGLEVMYQTTASVAEDEASAAKGARALLPKGTEIIEQRRETFYGAIEMILRDAAGNVITLAEMEE